MKSEKRILETIAELACEENTMLLTVLSHNTMNINLVKSFAIKYGINNSISFLHEISFLLSQMHFKKLLEHIVPCECS